MPKFDIGNSRRSHCIERKDNKGWVLYKMPREIWEDTCPNLAFGNSRRSIL